MPDTLGDDMASTFYVVSVSGLTANPIYGQTAQVGKPLYASAHYFSRTAPTSVGWQWCDGAGEIAGATGATYTPAPGDNLETLYPRATPDGSYSSRRGPAHTVRFEAPEAIGTLPDVSYAAGSGAQTIDAATGFAGDGLTYSLSTGIPDVTIDSSTGIVTIPTGSAASGPVTVTAANSGGSAQIGFDASITAAATVPAQMERPAITVNGPDSLRIDLGAASDDGGSPVTSYDMRWRKGNDRPSETSVIGISNPEFLTGLKADTDYQVRTRAVNAIGKGMWSRWSLDKTASEPVLDLPKLVPNADGTVDIMVNEGAFSVTVSESSNAHHNGMWGPFQAADLDTGPVSAVAPVASGNTGAGATLAAAPGLWVRETADSLTISGQWLRDGAPISGETGETYTTVSGDVGAVITYRETAANTAGTRTAVSSGITVKGAATAPARMDAPTLTVDSATQITAILAAETDDGGTAITSFDLRHSTDEATWSEVVGVTSPHAIPGLTPSTPCYVQTRAVNAVGNGAWSASAPATTSAATGHAFFDGFDQSDGTMLGTLPEYKDLSADIEARGGMAQLTSGTGTGELVYEGNTLADGQYIEAEIGAVGTGSYNYLYLRRSSYNDYYRVRIGTGYISVQANSATGGYGSLGAACSFTPTVGDRIRFEAAGSTLTVKLDEGNGFTTIMTRTDPHNTSGGAVLGISDTWKFNSFACGDL